MGRKRRRICQYDRLNGKTAKSSVLTAQGTPDEQLLFDVFEFDAMGREIRHTTPWNATTTTACGGSAGALMAILILQDLGLAQRCEQFGQFHLQEADGFRAYAMHAACLARQYLEPLLVVADEWQSGSEMGLRFVHARYAASMARNIRFGRSCYAHSAFVALVSHRCALLALHLGNDVQALEYALQAEPYWAATAGAADLIAMLFVLCVVAMAHPQEGAACKALIDVHRARIEKWALFTPQNFLHMKLLIDAWEARNEGRHIDAQRLFEESIADARDNGFLNHEALGLRMAGEYFLERKMPRAAKGYFHDAYDAYVRWGALGCAHALREQHAQFFHRYPAKHVFGQHT